jgi:putative PIN family toxin of toxin-antitoxin system
VRVVLDTNVLVSTLISAAGNPARIVEAWTAGQFVLVSHAIQLEELRDVTRRTKFRGIISSAAAGRLVNDVSKLADMPEKLPAVQRSPDPRDDFLLALCEAGNADWLVTGDKADLLALQRHGQTRIGSAAEFAKALNFDG